MFSLKNIAVLVASCVISGVCHAKSVAFGGETDGSLIETVTGIWTYNERIKFGSEGKYKLSFTDLDFGADFKYAGAMISTTDKKIASITIKDGKASSELPMEFLVGDQDYWISLFAFTKSDEAGTFGLQIASVSEVPAPPAVVLMFTSLLGLVSWVRSRRRSNKN
jgi:hypothetical protein